MQDNRWNLLEWLCINPRFLKSKTVGGIIFFLLFMAFLIFVPPTLFHFAKAVLGIEQFESTAERYDAIRNLGLVVAALIGVPFIIWRSVVAQKQVDVAEQGHITDRLNKAIEGLGSEKTAKQVVETPRYQTHNDEWLRDVDGNLVPAVRPDGLEIIDRETFERSLPNLEVRIGSIYALERIAQDSPRDHIQIMEILCTYVRENAKALNLVPTEEMEKRPVPRTDIQTAITVLGRRSQQSMQLERTKRFRLNLGNADLSGIDFRNGDFSAAQFHNCRIEAANFSNCELKGTQFFGALLNYTDFDDANLFGARLDRTIINRPILAQGAMSYSLTMAKVHGISIASADMTAIDYFGEHAEMNNIFGSKDTKLHDQLDFDRQKYTKKLRDIQILRKEGLSEEAHEQEKLLYKENGFVDWCPFDARDLAFGNYYGKFLDRLKLRGWPVTD